MIDFKNRIVLFSQHGECYIKMISKEDAIKMINEKTAQRISYDSVMLT